MPYLILSVKNTAGLVERQFQIDRYCGVMMIRQVDHLAPTQTSSPRTVITTKDTPSR